MIIDEVKVYLKAGNGGEGCCSTLWLSDRRIVGGGGDGGRGGDVILKVSRHCYDLYKFREKKKFVVDDGTRGSGSNKKGKNGVSIVVNVPEGTIIKDHDGSCIVDMAGEIKEFLICRGGQGGRGNYKKNCTFPPHEGQEKKVILDYRIPNDVAIVGFPNTGKTSLVNALTGKNFKTAHYPFTTTHCAWSCCESEVKRFMVMDTPPLKKDVTKTQTANFLKHLYRTKIIIFVSDSFLECLDDFSLLKQQVSLFDKNLPPHQNLWCGGGPAKKIFFYLLNKIDKIDRIENLKGVILVSAQKGIGIEELKKEIVNKL